MERAHLELNIPVNDRYRLCCRRVSVPPERASDHRPSVSSVVLVAVWVWEGALHSWEWKLGQDGGGGGRDEAKGDIMTVFY